MVMRINHALGLTVGDQVRASWGDGIHTIEQIWLYRPGEYEPYNQMSPGAPTGVDVDEPVVCLTCQLRYPPGKGHGGESYLNGIVERGGRWWTIAYDWPSFAPPAGLSLNERIALRMETAPPVLVLRDEVFMVVKRRSPVPLQLDMFAGATPP